MRMTRRTPWRLFTAVFVTVFAIGASTWAASADWTATAVSSGTAAVNAGATSVAATGTAALGPFEYKFTTSDAATKNLKIAALSFQNTGTTPVALSLTASNSNSNTALAVGTSLTLWASSSCGTTVPSTNITVGSLNAPPALPPGATTVAAGVTVQVCAATKLTDTIVNLQGQANTTTLTLRGDLVGTSWTGSAVAPAFTQNVYRVPNPTSVACAAEGLGIKLTWPAVTGATGFKVIKTNTPSFVVATGTGNTTTIGALNLGLDVLTGSGPLPITVQMTDSVYGTTSTGVTLATTYTVALPLLTVKCPA